MPTQPFGYDVTNHPTESAIGLINAVGDGNCGLRAAVQSLLIRGITTDKHAFVADFLQHIYDRQKDAVDINGRNLYASNTTKVDNPVPPSNQQANVLDLIQAYRTMTPSDLAKLRNVYFGTDNTEGMNAKMDHVIYVLAGCLRLDISDYVNDNPSERLPYGGDEDGRRDLRTLEKETDFNDTVAYFADHDISSTMESSNPSVPNQSLNDIMPQLNSADRFKFKKPEIEISIYHDKGNHFKSLIYEPIDSVRAAQERVGRGRVSLKSLADLDEPINGTEIYSAVLGSHIHDTILSSGDLGLKVPAPGDNLLKAGIALEAAGMVFFGLGFIPGLQILWAVSVVSFVVGLVIAECGQIKNNLAKQSPQLEPTVSARPPPSARNSLTVNPEVVQHIKDLKRQNQELILKKNNEIDPSADPKSPSSKHGV